MGENAKKIGDKLESFGKNLFNELGWIELTRDREIKCKRPSHSKRTHGIDLLCKFKNPYIQGNQGVIIECKNRQMKSITQSDIDNWVKELINNIECAQSSDELQDIDLSDVVKLNTGLLLVHANENWDCNKFYTYLSKLKSINRRNPINIFIAGNDRIEMWTSILSIINKSYSTDFSFIYPSINNYNKAKIKSLSLNAMFSKYFFGENTYFETAQNGGKPYNVPKNQIIMFFLDEITIDNFKYAWSMFKHFQFQGEDKYTFLFYPRNPGDREFVNENFIRSIQSGDHSIDELELSKINIDFIDNRSLSPVETGGAL